MVNAIINIKLFTSGYSNLLYKLYLSNISNRKNIREIVMNRKLKPLKFDKDGQIDNNEPVLRSRIKENFTFEELKELYDLIMRTDLDTNQKTDLIKMTVRDKGFEELGPGTNRYAMLKDNYVFKFALDHHGFKDNHVEFNMSHKLQPYVTKTYENNGLIAIAEYVTVIDKAEFIRNKPVIRDILSVLAETYLFEDLGCIEKNFRNWGYSDAGELIILDYGYIFDRDDILMRCTSCQSRLAYNNNYDTIVCSKCNKKFKIHDIKEMMNCSDSKRAQLFAKKKETIIDFMDDDAANKAAEKLNIKISD